MILIQPSIDPVILSIGVIDIRWYSLSYIMAFIYFYFFAYKNLKYFQLTKKNLEDLFLYMFLAVIIGGRIAQVTKIGIGIQLKKILLI